MAALFVKSIGHAGNSLPPDWLARSGWQDRLGSVVFPKYPRSVVRGSRLVYYGAGTRRFCAVMEVLSDEPSPNLDQRGAERWPFKLDVRPLVAIPADEYAPTLAAVGFDPLRLRRQSHVRLTEEEYDRLVTAILAAARSSTRLPNRG